MKRLFGFSNDFRSTDKLQCLRETMQRLKSIAEDVRTQVRNEEIQASKKQRTEVSLWVEEVDSMKEKLQIIETEIGKGGHSGVGEKLQRMVQTAENLIKQSEFTRGLVLYDFNPEGLELVTEKLEGSTPTVVQGEIWGCFERGKVRVGLYGMGGVGKTSVAMHINNKIVSQKGMIFHGVFYVTVSQDTNVYKLQNDIAKSFGLSKLMYEDEPMRAAELKKALRERRGSLLILDDVWEAISMAAIGVCVEGDGCKLLITTRRKDVCHKMSCFPVKINPLSENDSWELFKKQLGNYEELTGEVQEISRLVAKECDGLPLGIITMAGCMRGVRSELVWRDALRTLQDPCGYSQHDPDMEDQVFKILRFSYDRLKDEKLQKCFLYCALYPEDHKIEREELIRQFIAEGLLDGSRREEKIDRGHTLLNALENASLLESSEGRYHVKMHDLVRDMAIKIIGSTGLVKGGNSLKEVPSGELQCFNENLEWVSLMRNDIEKIEDTMSPNCPNVSVLLLQCNYQLKFIPKSFFAHMIGLNVLNLCRTDIEKLPDSVSDLANLKALLLSYCGSLYYIPPIGKLTKLKELVLECCTKLTELPEGMEELVSLEVLNLLSSNVMEGTLSGSFFGKLRNLDSFSSDFDKLVQQPSELLNLRYLTSLRVGFSDANWANHCIDLSSLNRLKTYNVSVGYHSDWSKITAVVEGFERTIFVFSCKLSIGKEVRFKVPHNVELLSFYECKFGGSSLVDDVPSLCRTSELKNILIESCSGIEYIISEDVHPCISFASLTRLEIIDCEKVKNLCALNIGLPNLEIIIIERCGEMEEIFVTEQGAAAELPRLYRMSVSDLPELRSICDNGFFCPQLRWLEVSSCPKVKKLAMRSHNLPSLKFLSVEKCQHIEEILATEEDADVTAAIQLPNLKELKMINLPELRSICRITLVCNSLELVEVDHLSSCKLENFPISIPRLSTTNSIREKNYPLPKFIACNVGTSWWLSLNWNDLNTKSILHERGCFTYRQDHYYFNTPRLLPLDLNIMPQTSPTNHTDTLPCDLDLHL